MLNNRSLRSVSMVAAVTAVTEPVEVTVVLLAMWLSSPSRRTGRNHRSTVRGKVYPDFCTLPKNQDRLSPVLKSNSLRFTNVQYYALLLSTIAAVSFPLCPSISQSHLCTITSSLVRLITVLLPFILPSPLPSPFPFHHSNPSSSTLPTQCCFLYQVH